MRVRVFSRACGEIFMLVRSPYNYDGDVVSHQTGLDCSDSPSRAQQHFRDECDINVMVERFQRTGVPPAPPVSPDVQDFTKVHDFRSAMQAVIDARSAFGSLPSKVRQRFANDPALMLDFLNDPSNIHEAERLGLVTISRVSRETSDPKPDTVASGDNSSVASPSAS